MKTTSEAYLLARDNLSHVVDKKDILQRYQYEKIGI